MRRAKRALDDLDADIRDHIEREIADNIDRGMTPAEARRQALLAFGSVALAREDTRAVWRWQWLDQLVQDSRYALRMLRRSPGFTVVAVLTLALGIGANTAIFSVVYNVLLRPLPYAKPDELVTISSRIAQTQARFPTLPVRAVDFLELRRSSRTLSELAAVVGAEFNLTGVGEPERLHGARVSANFFQMVGVHPAVGRAFASEEDTRGRDQVVVLSHDLWVRRFGADPNIVGKTVSLNGASVTVIGVMPASFLFPTGGQLHQYVPLGPRVDLWKPMAFSTDEATSGGSWNYGVVARMRSGTHLAVAQQELNAIAHAITERVRIQAKSANLDIRLDVRPIRAVFAGNIRRELLLLTAAVALLLLIACINLANLLVARSSSRLRELATRAAVGASRSRLARQVLTESGLVALLGAGVALIVAFWGTRALVSLAPPESHAVLPASPLNGPVLAFTMLAGLVAGLLVGVVPAIEIGRRGLFDDLRDASRAPTTGIRGIRLGQTLVALETGLTCGLAIVAGLLLHSFLNVLQVDKGFTAEQVLTLDVSLPRRSYTPEKADQFYQALVERTRMLPGIQSAGAASMLPLVSESMTRLIRLENDASYALDLERPVAVHRLVTPRYFATIGVPLQAGRFFEPLEPQAVAVISAGLAARLWPNEPLSSAVGRRIRPGDLNTPLVTIVGVVGDVHSGALDREPMPAIYRPQLQSGWTDMTLVVRTAGDPLAHAAAIRAVINDLDKDLPVSTMRTLEDVVSASVAARRFQTTLVVLFAALALALAAIGVYGVTSYAVARQTREIGIRIALGARPSRVLSTVLIRGLRPVAAGLAIGVLAAALIARAIQSFLFGVAPVDPTAFVAACGVLVLTAALACFLPARRAASVDPVCAIRLE